MKIIISPAKKMNEEMDSFSYRELPVFLNETKIILEYINSLNYEQQKKLWKCNDKIAEQNNLRFKEMDLRKSLSPAIFTYEGLQYQHIGAKVLESDMLEYLQENLRILSGFYGVIKPFDGIKPYRLEMQALTEIDGIKGLYSFWKDKLYKELIDEDRIILNLASKEYSKCIEPYITEKDCFITCEFLEKNGDRLVQKGTMAKIARGEMIRYLCENKINNLEAVKAFNFSGYIFNKEMSSNNKFVFCKIEK